MQYNYEGHRLCKLAFRIMLEADIQRSSASLFSIVNQDIKEISFFKYLFSGGCFSWFCPCHTFSQQTF